MAGLAAREGSNGIGLGRAPPPSRYDSERNDGSHRQDTRSVRATGSGGQMSREYYERIRKEERRYVCVLVIIAVFTVLGIAVIALVMRSL